MVQYIYLDNNKTPTWPERQQVMLLLFGAVLLTFQPGISLFLFVASLCVSHNSDSSVCVCIKARQRQSVRKISKKYRKLPPNA